MIVTLQCIHCDNIDCPIARKYVPIDSLEGCTRRVDKEQFELFQYYIKEVLPFIRHSKNPANAKERLREIESFLDTIYSCPLGTRIDSKGKAINTQKR